MDVRGAPRSSRSGPVPGSRPRARPHPSPVTKEARGAAAALGAGPPRAAYPPGGGAAAGPRRLLPRSLRGSRPSPAAAARCSRAGCGTGGPSGGVIPAVPGCAALTHSPPHAGSAPRPLRARSAPRPLRARASRVSLRAGGEAAAAGAAAAQEAEEEEAAATPWVSRPSSALCSLCRRPSAPGGRRPLVSGGREGVAGATLPGRRLGALPSPPRRCRGRCPCGAKFPRLPLRCRRPARAAPARQQRSRGCFGLGGRIYSPGAKGGSEHGVM